MVYQSDNKKNEAKVSRNKMEIITGYEIVREIEHADIIKDQILCDKKWVSVDSLLKLLKDDSIICYEDLQDQVIEELEK